MFTFAYWLGVAIGTVLGIIGFAAVVSWVGDNYFVNHYRGPTVRCPLPRCRHRNELHPWDAEAVVRGTRVSHCNNCGAMLNDSVLQHPIARRLAAKQERKRQLELEAAAFNAARRSQGRDS